MYNPQQQGQPVVASPGGAVLAANGGQRAVTDAEFLNYPSSLWRAGVLMLISGIVCALTFWAVYFMGAVLAMCAMWTGIMQMVHTGSGMESIRTSQCCFSPREVFHKLYIGNLVCLVCGSIGVVIAIAAIAVQDHWFRWVAIFGALGCIGCIVAGAMSFKTADRVHALLREDIAVNPPVVAAAPTTIVVSSAPVHPYPATQPVQQAQPVYPAAQPVPAGSTGCIDQPQQPYYYDQSQQQQQQGVYGNASNVPPPPQKQ